MKTLKESTALSFLPARVKIIETEAEEEEESSWRLKGYDGLDGVELVVDGRGRAGQVVDLVDLQEQRFHHVVADQLELGMPEVVHQVLLPPREEVVDDDHAVPSLDQPVNQVRPHESGTSRYHDPHRLPPQPQRNLPPGRPRHQPSGESAVQRAATAVDRRTPPPVPRPAREMDRPDGGSGRRREQRRRQEDGGGEGNAEEHAEEALVLEQESYSSDVAGGDHPTLLGLRCVSAALFPARGLVVAPVSQLRPHRRRRKPTETPHGKSATAGAGDGD